MRVYRMNVILVLTVVFAAAVTLIAYPTTTSAVANIETRGGMAPLTAPATGDRVAASRKTPICTANCDASFAVCGPGSHGPEKPQVARAV